jgi:hypothetical protein
MRFPVFAAACAAAALILGALWSALQGPLPGEGTAAGKPAQQETAELLQGTWVREYTADGVKVRRVLVLTPEGAFRESAWVTDPAGKVTQFEHEGTWLYDGTNLKRKYTSVNGKAPSRLRPPFATFEISFETRNEFVGIDHVHRNNIRYRRMAPDTQP